MMWKHVIVPPGHCRSEFEHLGKVFLSHASSDKPFVRRLSGRLRKAGVEVWLDERQLLVGDSLPEKVFKGVDEARAVIVVISATSVQSKWMHNELRAAIQRMIDGMCRVIPVLIDSIDLPPELTGILYADCRSGKRGGFAKILTALAEESRRARLVVATMESSDTIVRLHGLNRALDTVFGGRGSGSAEISATRDLDFDFVNVTTPLGREVDVIYDEITDYGFNRTEVATNDWQDWTSFVTNDVGERFGLLISERPPSRELLQRLNPHGEFLWSERLPASIMEPGGAIALVHLGLPITDAEAVARLTRTKELLTAEALRQVPPLTPLKELLAQQRQDAALAKVNPSDSGRT